MCWHGTLNCFWQLQSGLQREWVFKVRPQLSFAALDRFEKISVDFWQVLIGKESSAEIEEMEAGLINC